MIEKLLIPYIPQKFIEDERYRRGHIGIIHPLPGVRTLGLHIPDLRKIAARLVEEGRAESLVEAFLRICEKAPREGLLYEEKMIWGMLLNRLPLRIEERIEAFKAFVPAIDNWAVCDSICAEARWCRKHPAEAWEFLRPLFRSEREFEVRFALVSSLAHYLDAGHIDLIFENIAAIEYGKILSDYVPAKSTVPTDRRAVPGETPYYVYMAAAWLMAAALCKFPDQTRAFANSGTCPEAVLRLYVRKARESLRTKGLAAM